LNIRGNFGSFVEYDAHNIEEIKKISNNAIQTLTYFGFDREDLIKIIRTKNIKGFDRIVPIGTALDIDMVWDGMEIPYFLSRVVSVN
jgi:hypothetical protein